VVEWLDRKYSILLSFAATAIFLTLFGLSKGPREIMSLRRSHLKLMGCY
jgi:hypothetical protein